MTMINTPDDLLALLRENQEFRNAVRHVVLTDELLALPAAHAALVAEIREYIRTTDRRLQALEEGQQRLEERIIRLEEGQQRLEEGLQMLQRGQERLEEEFLLLKEGQQRHTDDIGELKGIGLETKLYNRGVALIASRLGVRGIRRMRVAEIDDNSTEFNDAIYKALDSGTFTEEEYERILDTDMIIHSRRPGSSTPVYAVIEASYSISREDISKVKLTTTLLGRILPDAEMHPALYYMNVEPYIKEEAEDRQVLLIQTKNLLA